MNEHTPQHHHTPTPATTDTAETDLIVGDPPVPITVWRTAHTTGDTGLSIGARLAARLIAAYSRPGEAVVDITADHALAAACSTGARSHHPAWFTDAASLIIGPATPTATPPQPAIGRAGDGSEAEDEVPELLTWFGDDLTDPDLPHSGNHVADPPPEASLQHSTSLVVACWPLDQQNAAANRVRLSWLLTACARLLRPGSCLILVVAVPGGTPTTPSDFTPVVQAAAGVGLGYLQHIVAVAADTDGDTFTYHVTDEELLSLAGGDSQQWTVAHLRVHADLMVFSRADRQRLAARRGGDQRG